jgi:hypothetical protein
MYDKPRNINYLGGRESDQAWWLLLWIVVVVIYFACFSA